MYNRPLSSIEHSLELFNQCANTWNIVTVSRVRGELTPGLLCQALDAAQTRPPMLQCCIVGSLEKPEFQRSDRAIPLRSVTKTCLEEWSDVANEELNQIAYPLLLGLKWVWFKVKSLSIATNIPMPKRGCRLIPYQLTEAQMKNLVRQCRDRKITVQSGLCAALLLSTSRQIPVNPDQAFTVSCDSAIDLRGRLNPPVSPGVLFSGATWVRTYHCVEPGIQFWDFAAQIEQKLNRAIEQEDMFKVAISSLAMSATVIKQPNVVHTTGIVSNLGQLRVPSRYSKFELEHIALWVLMLCLQQFLPCMWAVLRVECS
jgi:hypothetical protein